jgi:hypothetical protein
MQAATSTVCSQDSAFTQRAHFTVMLLLLLQLYLYWQQLCLPALLLRFVHTLQRRTALCAFRLLLLLLFSCISSLFNHVLCVLQASVVAVALVHFAVSLIIRVPVVCCELLQL